MPRRRVPRDALRNTTLKGSPLHYNASQQLRYVNALQKLVKQMTAETKAEVMKLFKDDTAQEFFVQQKQAAALDASIASQAKKLMNALTAKFSALFAKVSQPIAETMVEGASDTSESALHGSLLQLSKGVSVKTGIVPEGMEDVATAAVSENVSLIKSIPSQYFTNITGAVMRSITTGNGLKDLIPALSQYTNQTARRVKNLALDQTRKAYNSINKQRMQAVGVGQYEWLHSGGSQHPRKLHIAMSGNIYSFDDPPIIDERTGERGIPGQAINCKCTMIPIIDFDKSGQEK